MIITALFYTSQKGENGRGMCLLPKKRFLSKKEFIRSVFAANKGTSTIVIWYIVFFRQDHTVRPPLPRHMLTDWPISFEGFLVSPQKRFHLC